MSQTEVSLSAQLIVPPGVPGKLRMAATQQVADRGHISDEGVHEVGQATHQTISEFAPCPLAAQALLHLVSRARKHERRADRLPRGRRRISQQRLIGRVMM